MEIRQLKYFITVADAKSYQVAAKLLYVTPSAISKSISLLESELGVQLFIYKERSLSLTNAGTELYNMSKSIVMQFDMVKPSILGLQNHRVGSLRIGLPPIIGTCVFPELISGFAEEYPDIELLVFQYRASEIQRMVNMNIVDCGFTLSPVHETMKFIQPISKSGYAVIVHRTNPLSERKRILFSDLKGQKLILLNDTYMFHNDIALGFQKAGFIPQIIMYLNDWDLALRLANVNIGISILPMPIVNLYRQDNCVAIPIEEPNLEYSIVFIENSAHESWALKTFKDHIFLNAKKEETQ